MEFGDSSFCIGFTVTDDTPPRAKKATGMLFRVKKDDVDGWTDRKMQVRTATLWQKRPSVNKANLRDLKTATGL